MKKTVIAVTAAVALNAGVFVGVDHGKFTKSDVDLVATKYKVGYEFNGFGAYVYTQRDKLNYSWLTVSETSNGAGVQYNGGFGNDFGYSLGLSYGRGDIVGYEYTDRSLNGAVTYSVDRVLLEAGYKAKNMELDGADDTFTGPYIGISYTFGGE